MATLLSAGLLAGFYTAPVEASSPEAEQSRVVIEEVLADETFGRYEEEGYWKYIGEQEETETDGSWLFRFQYAPRALEGGSPAVTIEKGSITVDGVSLTVVDSAENAFSVAIIPYTYEHTCFQQYALGRKVNLEFDVIGKYVARLLEFKQ